MHWLRAESPGILKCHLATCRRQATGTQGCVTQAGCGPTPRGGCSGKAYLQGVACVVALPHAPDVARLLKQRHVIAWMGKESWAEWGASNAWHVR